MSSVSPDKCSWYPFIDEPLVESVSYARKFCNPCIIMPDKSIDHKWHMFFHSWIGIHHFISDSGIAWEPRKMIEFRGHHPFIYTEGDSYYLIYEKHDKSYPILNQKRADGKNDSFSRIEMRVSTDLITWSKPRVLLDSRVVPFSMDYISHPRFYCPQLFKVDGGYRLYFGSSNVRMQDTGFKAARYLGYAFSKSLLGPYYSDNSSILLEPNGDDPYSNLATGNVKIVRIDDSYYAFQCGFFWDDEKKISHSAISVLQSEDGLHFTKCCEKPIMINAQEGWASTYIQGCDAHYKADEGCWYLYFSAQSETSKPRGKESIGLLIGKSKF